MSDDELLRAANLTKSYSGLLAVDSVDFTLSAGNLYAIIGPNGAGKTTLFNLLTGFVKPSAGSIFFKGIPIDGMSPDEIARRGLVRSYQITRIFDKMTVLENVRIAVQTERNPYDFWRNIDSTPELTNRALAVLERVNLHEQADKTAVNLSHGEKRTLEIAIALGTKPDMLLLDEPSSGMSPHETKEVISLIDDLSSSIPILMIEHKMSVVRQVADRIIAMHNGGIIAEGRPGEVRNDTKVRRVYLGDRDL